MSRDPNARRSHCMKSDNSCFERVEDFKCSGTTLNKNSIQEEIKSRLNSGNACYHSVQNLLSFSLLSKNIKSTRMHHGVLRLIGYKRNVSTTMFITPL